MTSAPVLHLRREGAVALLELNRPASKNALDATLVEELGASLEKLGDDAGVRAVVLLGAGGAFCSGADLKASFVDDPDLLDHLPARLTAFHRIVRAIVHAPKPFIAAVDGPAVGFGCDLALACDLRLVTEGGYFQEKFVKIGLMPDGGGTFFLPRLIGVARAFEMIYGGEPVHGAEAVRIGLANRLVAPEALVAEALALADRLAGGPPLAFARIKRAVWAGAGGTFEDALLREREGQLACLRSADAMEGISAWIQKRSPKFEGR